MPLVKIELQKGRSSEYKKAILNGVHSALVEAFKIPDYDRNQRIHELDPECIELPPNKTDQFTLIEITAFKGRSGLAKKNLFQSIVRNLQMSPGISGDDIMIIIHEPPLENWGIRGGQPANEVDLGFNIEV
jgi:phenylpyruvate tautomerase PptA (4-oxalocrotonate tautomerase family)